MSGFVLEDFIIGQSAAMRALRSEIRRLAASHLSVLVLGPTGAGKELVARALHQLSGRRGPFVAVNVCAIAEPMFEDTFFGHVKGAYTGAAANRRGCVEEAHEGTLFLDEISGISPLMQAKLLRVLETGTYRPVGAGTDRRSDIRVVAATNEDVMNERTAERFRRDLLHRLSGDVIVLPALHERLEDVALLARHFLTMAARTSGVAPVLAQDALRALRRHTWPGNVRELRNVVERARLRAENGVVSRDVVNSVLARAHSPAGVREDLAIERHQLLDLLDEVGWDKQAAAERLSVHVATVYRWLKAMGIDPRYGRLTRGGATNGFRANSREFARKPDGAEREVPG
ncbi:MAG TPA: sigma-54 dependent transcriptional regulator [Gemmatimonadaceae bacterium]|nr:sigma-54 dependent transcriptional regulator [Gemmatimonadaceae bacterium]